MKIPYGIHDYKTIKTENYLFVDKTKFINKIEELSRYIVFLRPRRFGKSLFTSMLYYYYDINSIKLFDNLFSDTYIGRSKTQEANIYYILRFDFSGISTESDVIEKDFYDSVYIYLQRFINYYNLDIELDKSISNANTLLKYFLTQFESEVKGQIYLMIDEYDHFANNVMTSDIELFNDITGKDGFVRSFYEVFKTYAGTAIGRIFITGVTPITLDSLTSGFNMAEDLSKEELLNEMMGFTTEEVNNILESCNIDKFNLNVLKENYNGYLFSQNAQTKLYNSNMVLYYVKPFTIKGKPPSNLVDANIVSDYTKLTNMFDLYDDFEDKKNIINNILSNKPIITTIIDKFNLKLGFNKDDFLSLLYYLGLLTIDESWGSDIALKTPNYIIKNIYFEYYFHYLKQELNIRLDVRHIKDNINEMSINNNVKPFISLVEKFLNEISNREYIQFDEKYIKLIIIMYLRLSNAYLVKSEYEVNGEYMDIALLPNNIYDANHYFVFEIKYISVGNFNEKLLNKKREEAISQICSYTNNEEFVNMPKLRKYILIFVKSECRLIEEI